MPHMPPSAEEMVTELDKIHEHIKAFKEYGQPLPPLLIEKLRVIREDAQAAMNAQE